MFSVGERLLFFRRVRSENEVKAEDGGNNFPTGRNIPPCFFLFFRRVTPEKRQLFTRVSLKIQFAGKVVRGGYSYSAVF